jgi:cation transport ATPase
MRYGLRIEAEPAQVPLWCAYLFGGIPLVWGLLVKLWRREFGSDLLAGLSIVTALLLGEYLAGTLVILMLSGGEAIEAFAVRHASSVLAALAKRVPSVAAISSKCCLTKSVRSMARSSRGAGSWTSRISRGNPIRYLKRPAFP